MNVVVTGGLGLIGGNLINLLSNRDHSVYCIDSCSHHCFNPKQVKARCSIFDLTDPRELREFKRNLAMRCGKIDWVVHLAGPVGPKRVTSHEYFEKPIPQLTINLFQNALSIARELGGAKFLFTSSSEVYGSSPKRLLKEDDMCYVPPRSSRRDEYALSKLLCEKMLVSYNDHVVVRPFNVAGPRQRQDSGFVIPIFVRQALIGSPLTVFEPDAIRSFIHVKDCVSAILHLLEGDFRGVYNVGANPDGIRIMQLAEFVKDLLNSDSEIKVVDPKKYVSPLYEFAFNKRPDLSKIHSTGWKAKFSLEDIVGDVRDEFLLR